MVLGRRGRVEVDETCLRGGLDIGGSFRLRKGIKKIKEKKNMTKVK